MVSISITLFSFKSTKLVKSIKSSKHCFMITKPNSTAYGSTPFGFARLLTKVLTTLMRLALPSPLNGLHRFSIISFVNLTFFLKLLIIADVSAFSIAPTSLVNVLSINVSFSVILLI